MSTIREVAKLAGVAPITVSRVINNSGPIQPETRTRVEKAIEQLGYVPNNLARGLRWRQTRMLALVLTDIANPFWTTMARGVEDAASEAGYHVIFGNTDESLSKEQNYLQTMMQQQVDGVILAPVSSETGAGAVEFIQRQKVPVVVVDRRVHGVAVDTVRCDSIQAAYDLTRLFLAQGHRRIGLLSGPLNVSTSVDRVIGFRQALEEAGLAALPEWTQHGVFTVESGREMAERVLASNPRPTAILAGNNFLTVGTLRTLKAVGLRVPEDISIAGFDDMDPNILIDPFLTVAAQPAYQMGYQATRLLLERILAVNDTQEYREILLPVEIIVRRSVSPWPGQSDVPGV
jgi:LacI family transcriptional regulator